MELSEVFFFIEYDLMHMMAEHELVLRSTSTLVHHRASEEVFRFLFSFFFL